MQDCLSCEHVARERWARGVTAYRCMAELPKPWGNGRVVGRPSEFEPVRIDVPRWCPQHPDHNGAAVIGRLR